jgi:hypothetical protein
VRDDDHQPCEYLVQIVSGSGALGPVVHRDRDEPAIALTGEVVDADGHALAGEERTRALAAVLDPGIPLGHPMSLAQDRIAQKETEHER